MRLPRLAALLWSLLAFTLLRQIQTGFASFLLDFDHCRGMGCDYRQFYLPQAVALPEGRIEGGWTSPPLLALSFAALPFGGKAWLALDGVALVALVAACWRRIGAVAVPLVLLSMPVWHPIKWGQPSLVLAVAAVAVSTPEWLPAGRAAEGLRGTVLGLLAAIKVYPAFWGASDLLARRWRVVAVAAVMGLIAGVILPIVLLPDGLGASMWSAVRRIQIEDRAASVAESARLGGQGLPASLTRWFELGSVLTDSTARDALLITLPRSGRSLLELGTMAAVLASLWSFRRSSMLVGTATAMLGFTLLLNPGWHHYFAFLPWAQALVWERIRSRELARGAGALLALSIAFSSVGMLGLADIGDLYWTLTRWGATTLSVATALAALVLVREEVVEDAAAPTECHEPA